MLSNEQNKNDPVIPVLVNEEKCTAGLPVETTISRDGLNELPLFRFEGDIQVISSDEDTAAAVAQLKQEKLLGFDTETRPSFQKGQNFPPALLQLAGASKVYLFQLLQLKELDPILSILSDPEICKAGVAIRDDIRKLQEFHSFNPGGFLELSNPTQRAGIVNTGLRSLAGIFLQIRISKGAQVSNWSKKNLTEAQIRYAATDAWVSREICERLLDLGILTGHSAA